MKKIFTILILTIFLAFINTCDEGLAPLGTNVTKITGTINYIGGIESWQADSIVKEIRIIAFQVIPDTNVNIILEIINGNAFYTKDTLPRYVAQSNFTIEIPKPPVNLKYIVAVKRFGDDIFNDWRVIGLYHTSGDDTKPESIYAERGRIYNITINVDLNKLPPQPF